MGPNANLFVLFRCLFNARFYYPVFTIFFLDHGLSLEQFALLNTIWAVTIVLLEVPSGALADVLGRKRLVVGASVLMLFEMLFLLFTPPDSPWVFWAFAANRILSGSAEAAASGADEALTYDSLPSPNREQLWGKLMARTMRWQSICFLSAMFLGGFFYDVQTLNSFLQLIHKDIAVSKYFAMKLPIALCTISSLFAILVTLKMREEKVNPKEVKVDLATCFSLGNEAFATTLKAGLWVLKSGPVFSVIVFAMAFDSVVRMFMTLSSEYFRSLNFTEASLGLIGGTMGLMGLIIPSIAEKMGRSLKRIQILLALAIITFLSLWSLQLSSSKPMLIFAFILSAMMSFLGFFVSMYVNKDAPPQMRATVLSFRGLSYNLAYGITGILYSLLVAHLRGALDNSLIFERALSYFPHFFATNMVLAMAVVLLQRRLLAKNTNKAGT